MDETLEDDEREEWSWCLHCEQGAPTASWEDEGWECPSCGAGEWDMWRWSKIRAANPSYPEFPLMGVVYPQYGQNASEV